MGVGNKQGVWTLPKYFINKGGGWNFSKYLINEEEKQIGWNFNNLAKIIKKYAKCKKYQKINKPGDFGKKNKLQEEKDANCEKLYCCGRKSCESCEIFLATFSFRNFFFPQQLLYTKHAKFDEGTISKPFSEKSKLNVSLDQQPKVFYNLFLL